MTPDCYTDLSELWIIRKKWIWVSKFDGWLLKVVRNIPALSVITSY